MGKKKKKLTVTNRYITTKQPIAIKPASFTPDNVRERLSLVHLSEKQHCTAEMLTLSIRKSAPNAIFIADTSFFLTQLDECVWDAILEKQLLITPAVWAELTAWRREPRQNRPIRDVILQSEQQQSANAELRDRLMSEFARLRPGRPIPWLQGVEIQTAVESNYKAMGYRYYFNLLALRKWIGSLTEQTLSDSLGRAPTEEEFLKATQIPYGERGFLLAKKGRDGARSTNLLNDEQLVVMAVQTAIMRGCELIILTRDADIQEQFFKLACLIKEHYRCMLVADHYAANPTSMSFEPMGITPDGPYHFFFEGPSVLVCQTTERELDVLPQTHLPFDISCVLISGERDNLGMTFHTFRAESEIQRVLKLKHATGGLSTDKLDGKNCYVETSPMNPEECSVKVLIGKEKRQKFAHAEFSGMDWHNALFCNEQITRHIK